MQYVRVENNAVVEGPRNIPISWDNISGFHLLSNIRLKSYNWYPVVYGVKPVFDPDTERIIINGYTINPDDITVDYDKEGLSAEEITEIADRALRAQDIIDNLSSWSQVETAVDNISNIDEAKAFIKKMARVVYWLAKNTSA